MRGNRGFTLVELLFALLILTVVITTTLAVFVERTHRQRTASELVAAYQALANEAELVRRVPFDKLKPATTFESGTEILVPLQPYATAVTVQDVEPGLKKVTLSIRWRNGERTARLSLLRVDTGGGNLW